MLQFARVAHLLTESMDTPYIGAPDATALYAPTPYSDAPDAMDNWTNQIGVMPTLSNTAELR